MPIFHLTGLLRAVTGILREAQIEQVCSPASLPWPEAVSSARLDS